MISSPDPYIGRQLHQVIRRRLSFPASFWKMVTYTNFPRENGPAFSYAKASLISPLPRKNLPDHIDAKFIMGQGWRVDG